MGLLTSFHSLSRIRPSPSSPVTPGVWGNQFMSIIRTISNQKEVVCPSELNWEPQGTTPHPHPHPWTDSLPQGLPVVRVQDAPRTSQSSLATLPSPCQQTGLGQVLKACRGGGGEGERLQACVREAEAAGAQGFAVHWPEGVPEPPPDPAPSLPKPLAEVLPRAASQGGGLRSPVRVAGPRNRRE